jgi:hypothetical protein
MDEKLMRDWFLWADARGYEWAPKAMHNLLVMPLREDTLKTKTSYLYLAVGTAFRWARSPEGVIFWENIYSKLMADNL